MLFTSSDYSLLCKFAFALCASLASAYADAAVVYSNTFSSPTSLNDFSIFTRDDASASIDDGQLALQLNSISARAYASLNLAAHAPALKTILSENPGLVTWAFNVSNSDGAFNNAFVFVIAGTDANPTSATARGYFFNGGGLVRTRMLFRNFGPGLYVDMRYLIDVTSGLSTLPEKGSFRLTYAPGTEEWRLYGEFGPDYVDPRSVETLLGSAIDARYTSLNTPYLVLGGETTGTVYIDNFSVTVIPEPSGAVILSSSFAGCFAVIRSSRFRRCMAYARRGGDPQRRGLNVSVPRISPTCEGDLGTRRPCIVCP
jgi:hypothetical protein